MPLPPGLAPKQRYRGRLRSNPEVRTSYQDTEMSRRAQARSRAPRNAATFVREPSNGRLKLWIRASLSQPWSLQPDESWVGGQFVNPSTGIAVIGGFLAGDAAPSIFAAIPEGPSGQIEFARRVGSTWTSVGGFLLQGAQPVTKARPGLAYVPWDVSSPSTGRFYMFLEATGRQRNRTLLQGWRRS
jgi:hypothetical protein